LRSKGKGRQPFSPLGRRQQPEQKKKKSQDGSEEDSRAQRRLERVLILFSDRAPKEFTHSSEQPEGTTYIVPRRRDPYARHTRSSESRATRPESLGGQFKETASVQIEFRVSQSHVVHHFSTVSVHWHPGDYPSCARPTRRCKT
jgi:hypothetical protein